MISLMKKNKNIETLFQESFSEYQEEVSSEEMELIRQYTEKKAFFKFSFSRFNIYYALMICSCFLLSGYSAFKYLTAQNVKVSSVLVEEELIHKDQILKKNHEDFHSGKENLVNSEKTDNDILTNKSKDASNTVIGKEVKLKSTDYTEVVERNQNKRHISQTTEQLLPDSSYLEGQIDLDSIKTLAGILPKIDSLAQNANVEDTGQAKEPVVIIVQDTIYKVDTVRNRLFSIFKRD